jgi:hypothetical protein
VLNNQKMDQVFSEDDLDGRVGRKTCYKRMLPTEAMVATCTRLPHSEVDEKGATHRGVRVTSPPFFMRERWSIEHRSANTSESFRYPELPLTLLVFV